MTHYLIYKITNNLNGKIYIGKHKTENIDDGYMGSGVAINRAIKKYGVENFTKEILFDVYGEDLMNFLEEAIVDEAFVAREDTYNMMTGGMGGHVLEVSEETRKKISEKAKGRPSAFKGRHFTEEQRGKLSESCKGRIPWNKGLKGCQKMSDATKEKMSKKRKGMVAHNKGLRWFNNGQINRQSKECPEGFVPGRLRKAV